MARLVAGLTTDTAVPSTKRDVRVATIAATDLHVLEVSFTADIAAVGCRVGLGLLVENISQLLLQRFEII
jgi:hypothetical protein